MSIEHLVNQFFTHAIKFQSTAPIQNRAAGSCDAKNVHAFEKRSFKLHLTVAGWAGTWAGDRGVDRELASERLAGGMEAPVEVARTCRPKRLFNLRNHIATAYDEHLVSKVDAKPFNLTDVVQGGVLNGNTSNPLWCNPCHGRDVSRSPGLPFDIEKDGKRLFRGEFPSERPTGVMRRHAQPFPLFEVVKFEHHAIDFVGVIASLVGPDLG